MLAVVLLDLRLERDVRLAIGNIVIRDSDRIVLGKHHALELLIDLSQERLTDLLLLLFRQARRLGLVRVTVSVKLRISEDSLVRRVLWLVAAARDEEHRQNSDERQQKPLCQHHLPLHITLSFYIFSEKYGNGQGDETLSPLSNILAEFPFA